MGFYKKKTYTIISVSFLSIIGGHYMDVAVGHSHKNTHELRQSFNSDMNIVAGQSFDNT